MAEPFVCKLSKKTVMIDLDDDLRVTVSTEDGKEIGSFLFREDIPDGYFLLNISLGGCKGAYKRQGIGEQILLRHIDIYGGPISAQGNDGVVREDGSNLVGDGAAFVAAMRAKGLITRDPYDPAPAITEE